MFAYNEVCNGVCNGAVHFPLPEWPFFQYKLERFSRNFTCSRSIPTLAFDSPANGAIISGERYISKPLVVEGRFD